MTLRWRIKRCFVENPISLSKTQGPTVHRRISASLIQHSSIFMNRCKKSNHRNEKAQLRNTYSQCFWILPLQNEQHFINSILNLKFLNTIHPGTCDIYFVSRIYQKYSIVYLRLQMILCCWKQEFLQLKSQEDYKEQWIEFPRIVISISRTKRLFQMQSLLLVTKSSIPI